MTHESCAARWTLTVCEWTSTQVRRQDTTRIQVIFEYQESYGFQFDQRVIARQAMIPVLPLDPTAIGMDALDEARSRKRGLTSPTPSEAPNRKRVHTQTDVQSTHFNQLPRKLFSHKIRPNLI